MIYYYHSSYYYYILVRSEVEALCFNVEKNEVFLDMNLVGCACSFSKIL